MRRCHPVAAVVEDEAGQNRRGGRAADAPGDGLVGKFLLYGIEQAALEDGLMFAGVDFAAVKNLADIEPVLEKIAQRPDGERPAAASAAGCEKLRLNSDLPPPQLLRQDTDRSELEIEIEDQPDGLGFFRDNDQLLVLALVAKGNRTADSKTFLLRGGDLVAHPLADDLPFKLGEGEQDIEGEPAHARGRIEGLGDRDE